jgi:hypothetical protein
VIRLYGTKAISKSGEVLRDQTHRELVYCPLQFHKRNQLFIRAHDETLSAAMCVSYEDYSPRESRVW